MARGPSTFKQTHVSGAVKAVVATGVELARVEVDKDGRITVVAGKPLPNDNSSPDRANGGNEWDRI
jgi:hypothetical protein